MRGLPASLASPAKCAHQVPVRRGRPLSVKSNMQNVRSHSRFSPQKFADAKIPFPKVRCKVMLARNWETNFMTLGALTLHPAGTTLARHSCTAAHTAVTSVTLRPEWIFKVVHFLYKHCSRISSIRVMPITYSSLAKQHGEIEVPKTFEAIRLIRLLGGNFNWLW